MYIGTYDVYIHALTYLYICACYVHAGCFPLYLSFRDRGSRHAALQANPPCCHDGLKGSEEWHAAGASPKPGNTEYTRNRMPNLEPETLNSEFVPLNPKLQFHAESRGFGVIRGYGSHLRMAVPTPIRCPRLKLRVCSFEG